MLPTFLLNTPLYFKLSYLRKKFTQMKNFITGLTLATAIGVAVLFYLHFSGSKSTAAPAGNTVSAASSGFRIAYFESDSIQNN